MVLQSQQENGTSKLAMAYEQARHWCASVGCASVRDLNSLARGSSIRELVRTNEALHEKQFAYVASQICHHNAKVVMLAGPSASGKTTSANRLATHLRAEGKHAVIISLDDYYVDRHLIAPGPDGKLDLEHIHTIDTQLFRLHVTALLEGGTVQLPGFDFLTGKRYWTDEKLMLSDNTVLIVEGLHALNPMLHSQLGQLYKLYVTALQPLISERERPIPSSFMRLLRRMIRDHDARGASVQQTLSMWEKVRQGEQRWIYPFQEQADYLLNSGTAYELAVLKAHILPLLEGVPAEDPWHDDIRQIMGVLEDVIPAQVDDEIPINSLVREFIGGNTYYRQVNG